MYLQHIIIRKYRLTKNTHKKIIVAALAVVSFAELLCHPALCCRIWYRSTNPSCEGCKFRDASNKGCPQQINLHNKVLMGNDARNPSWPRCGNATEAKVEKGE